MKDSYKIKESIYYEIERDDLYLSISSSNVYFRGYTEFSDIEKKYLEHVDGKVLDLIVGASRMSLYLQKNGIDVTAVDVSKGAVSV